MLVTEQGIVAYCSNPTKALAAIEKLALQHGTVLLFARKVTDATRDRLTQLGNVSCQPVPQELLDMFGVTE